MTEAEFTELLRRVDAGERVFVQCENDREALRVQSDFEARVTDFVSVRKDGYLKLRYGGEVILRAPKRSLSQAQMLQEAVSKALNGDAVMVTAIEWKRVELLRGLARSAIPEVSILPREEQHRIRLRGGGELRFGVTETHREGFRGEVYLSHESGEAWDRGTTPYIPEPLPRRRFQRIDDE